MIPKTPSLTSVWFPLVVALEPYFPAPTIPSSKSSFSEKEDTGDGGGPLEHQVYVKGCRERQTASNVHLFVCLLSFEGRTRGTGRFPGEGSHRSYSCWPQPQPRHCRVPHPLNKARDRTVTLVDPSWVYFCRATVGTPELHFQSFLVYMRCLSICKCPSLSTP